MNTRLAYVVFAFSFIVVIYVGLIRNAKDDLESKALPLKTFRPKHREPAASPTSSAPAVAVPEKHTSALPLDAFLRKYGDELVIERDSEKRVVAFREPSEPENIRSPGQRLRGFSVRDSEQVVARAREILNDSRAILGLTTEMPLIDPKVSGTDLHAQVVFTQSQDGVPIVPSGTVSVLIGAEGELKSLESDYLRRAMIANQPKLPQTTGRHVLWVHSTLPVAQLRHAYETRESGFQVVVDAEDGRTLLRRNKRIH